jgi:3'-phosphoadenosine 5'-phosphosulfate sulfotransferase (PAPS reductase)/FAD synthetase
MKHIVGFSGGIDSQACARWVLNRYPPEDVILTNSTAGGWEDPLTVQFIADYSAAVFPVTVIEPLVSDMWDTPGYAEQRGLDGSAVLTFEEMCRIKGRPPSRKAQFCTSFLKLKPQRRWIRAQFSPTGPYAGDSYCRYKGVRRDESNARAQQPFEEWDEWFDCTLYAPLADWSKTMCFDYVKAHGEAFNPLYTLGFDRVGCAPCINCSKDDILNWQARRPEMIEKVRGLEARTGRTFFKPVDRDGILNGIDAVVRWASTKRGGDKLLLPMMLEREGCESKYGLCE